MTLCNAILDIIMWLFHILYLVPWGFFLLFCCFPPSPKTYTPLFFLSGEGHYRGPLIILLFFFLFLYLSLRPCVFLWLNPLSLCHYSASTLSHLSHCFPYLTLGLECTCRKPWVYLPSQPWWGLCGILWCVTGWQEVVISLSG